MTKKVLISQKDANDLYIRTLSACDIHHADKYAAQLFCRVLCDFIQYGDKSIEDWFDAQPDKHAISAVDAYMILGIAESYAWGEKTPRGYALLARCLGLPKEKVIELMNYYHGNWDINSVDWQEIYGDKSDEN